MKTKKLLFVPLTLLTLSSCSLVKGLEHDLNVVFEYNGEIISHTVVNEFNNGLAPTLTSEMIPENHRFYGWTWLNPDSIDITKYTDEKNKVTDDFYKLFIEYDDVVHYHEVKDFAYNTTVTLRPLFIDEDIIPVPNYYIAIGWYAKSSTSGLNEILINNWTNDLKEFLKTKGATEQDLGDVVITPYEGDVATAGSLINKDRFNDLLIGFGGNIGTNEGDIGGVEYIQNVGGIPMGGKTRYITQITDKPIAVEVFNWLQTEEGHKALN